MWDMDIQPSNQKVGKKSCNPNISIRGAVDRVFSEILDAFSAFSPCLRYSVTAKEDSVEDETEDCIKKDMKFQGISQASRAIVEKGKDSQGNQIPELRKFSINERHHAHFDNKVQRLDEGQDKDDNGLGVKLIFWQNSQEICKRLHGCGLVVQFCVGIYVMAEAVHDLPLIVGEACQNKEVFEEVFFVVDEVMANPDDPDQLEGSDCCKDISPVGRILHVYGICCNTQCDQEK